MLIMYVCNRNYSIFRNPMAERTNKLWYLFDFGPPREGLSLPWWQRSKLCMKRVLRIHQDGLRPLNGSKLRACNGSANSLLLGSLNMYFFNGCVGQRFEMLLLYLLCFTSGAIHTSPKSSLGHETSSCFSGDCKSDRCPHPRWESRPCNLHSEQRRLISSSAWR